MQLLEEYINQFLSARSAAARRLGAALSSTRRSYDAHAGRDPVPNFRQLVDRYNWLGDPANKATYKISQNLARNLTGALLQDYLIHLVIRLLRPFPSLDVFTEVRVAFGLYPLWQGGAIDFHNPAQQVDLAVGYKMVNGQVVAPNQPWPRAAISHLQEGEAVLPLIVINSKIRVSQGEFFDWFGREALLTRGNPNCLSLQVALRAEMDLNIVKAAQAEEKFFLVGRGGERTVVGDPQELGRLVERVNRHLTEHMR